MRDQEALVKLFKEHSSACLGSSGFDSLTVSHLPLVGARRRRHHGVEPGGAALGGDGSGPGCCRGGHDGRHVKGAHGDARGWREADLLYRFHRLLWGGSPAERRDGALADGKSHPGPRIRLWQAEARLPGANGGVRVCSGWRPTVCGALEHRVARRQQSSGGSNVIA